MRCREQEDRLGLSCRHWLAGCLALALLAGCATQKKPPAPISRYPQLPPKNVPAFLKDSVFERTDLAGTESFVVSGFGLVTNLAGTGDSTAPTPVREYMIREMTKRGFGSSQRRGFEDLKPERVLADKRVAIVRVDGALPPGARQNQRFDILVTALPESLTTSLARGRLYRTDLRIDGANPMHPAGTVDVLARSEGQIFVNPAYGLASGEAQNTAKASLRSGVVLAGGIAFQDRPLILRLRQPQHSLARAIERRIDQFFQDTTVAAARDEGIVWIYLPAKYNSDWQHFTGVVQHLYLNPTPEFAALKAKQLVDEALKPDAALMNISYCWEGLGPPALPFIRPLMSHAAPEVAFAAARAAAFLADNSALTALMEMARNSEHPFQISAVQTLGSLPNAPALNYMLRELLDSPQAMVRIEAYSILARNNDPLIFSKAIQDKFVLDLVPSRGPPLIYASRSGIPRIAIFGEKAAIEQPLTFLSMDGMLSISSNNEKNLVIFYRGPEVGQPIKVLSRADLPEVVARLGGAGPADQRALDFTYGDVVGILQALSDARRLTAVTNGQRLAANFVLQELPQVQDVIRSAPALPVARPQADEPGDAARGDATDAASRMNAAAR